MAGLLGFFMMYAGYVNTIHRVIVFLLAVTAAAWYLLLVEHVSPRTRLGLPFVLASVLLVLDLQVGKLIEKAMGSAAAINFERLTTLFPLAFAIGWLLVRTGRVELYLRTITQLAVLTVLPAIYEYASNTTLLQTDHSSYVRNGQTRAVVGADHPLVLATIFLALMPVSVWVFPRWGRLASVWLFLGVLATGSNGPSAVGAGVLLICLLAPFARLVISTPTPLRAGLCGIVAFLAYGASSWWGTQLDGRTTSAVSNQYRAGLYWLLPRLLPAHPFGYGLGGLPPDHWYFYTLAGTVDVASSVDSEAVLDVAEFGLIGLAFYVSVCWLATSLVVRNQALGLALLAINLAGFFLALHAWESLGSFWMIFIGASSSVYFGSGERSHWLGLTARREPARLKVSEETSW